MGWTAAAVVTLLITGSVTPASAASSAPKPLLPKTDTVLHDPQFQWRPVPGATSYRLEVALDRAFTNIVYSIKTPATRYMDTATWPAGSYWWRVRAVSPFRTRNSAVQTFTRRWVGPDGKDGRGREIARPDNVQVADYSSAAGVQVPQNAIKVSWEPVAGASHYQVQFDGETSKVCETAHTVFTPYETGELAGKSESCNPELEPGLHWVRVRAVDESADGQTYFSLWSDQARSTTGATPATDYFTVGDKLAGPNEFQPAVPKGPANGQVFNDVPTLRWEPVQWAKDYRVVIARDQDFTNRIGEFRTSNTMLTPMQRLPEHDAVRSYYWYAVPCLDDKCLNENRAINRSGFFRSFKKKTILVEPTGSVRKGTPWVEFRWEPFETTVADAARRTGAQTASRGGIQWYELQWRPYGGKWSQGKKITTDLSGYLATELSFGRRYEWRVRPVDETGDGRPWSETETTKIPRAVAKKPKGLSATRRATKVTLRWRAPASKYFPVTGYSIFWSTNGKRWKPIAQVKKTRATLRVSKKSRYWFMVTATNHAGEGAPAKVFVPRG